MNIKDCKEHVDAIYADYKRQVESLKESVYNAVNAYLKDNKELVCTEHFKIIPYHKQPGKVISVTNGKQATRPLPSESLLYIASNNEVVSKKLDPYFSWSSK